MPSPVKETIASFQPLAGTQLHPPPSPGTHRALRRLQSAHSLGAKAANPPSLISQQRHQLQLQHQLQHSSHQPQPQSHAQHGQSSQHAPFSHQQSSGSPVRRNATSNNRSPQRNRANSDATTSPVVQQQQQVNSYSTMPPPPTTKRSALSRRSLAADHMSLDRLLRDGPPGGDIGGSLESARLKILDQGIKSDSDGMVSLSPRM
jgi:cell cycle arrest protein BUB2